MKKISIIALALVVVFSLSACGRRNNNENTIPATTDNGTIIPDMDPTFDTNIPDPDVDTSMPMYTEGTDNTLDTGMTDNTIGR